MAEETIVLGQEGNVSIHNDESSSNDKSTQRRKQRQEELDELMAMMRFVGDNEGVEGIQSKKQTVILDESDRVTRGIIRQHRAEQAAEKQIKKRHELYELTMKNLQASESIYQEQQNDENEKTGNLDAAGLTQFEEFMAEGGRLIKANDADAASKMFKKAVDLNPGSVLAKYSLGSALLKNGDTRDSLQSFLSGLKQLKEGAQDQQGLEEKILAGMVHGFEDIGKMAEAEKFQNQLDALKKEKQGKSATESAKKERVEIDEEQLSKLPADLRASLDEAIEAAISGQFGLLRAVLMSFVDGRGDITLNHIMSYQHSKTGANGLMVAAAKGELTLVNALIQFGSPLDLVAFDGSNALLWACRFDQPEAVEALLEAGAQFTASVKPEMIASWSSNVQQAISSFVQSKKKAAPAKEEATAPKPPPAGKKQQQPKKKPQQQSKKPNNNNNSKKTNDNNNKESKKPVADADGFTKVVSKKNKNATK